MKEDQDDTQRHNVSNGEEPSPEEGLAKGSTIGKLILHQLAVSNPPHQDTRQESASRQHQLGRQEVAEIEQRHAKQLQIAISTHRQGAENGNHGTNHRQYPGCTMTRQFQFLMKEDCTNLMHGNGGGEGSKDQQGIEQDGDDITHHRHSTESLTKHIGQGDEYQ